MTSYHVEAGCVAVTYFMTHKLFNAWHWNFKRSKTNCCHQTRAFVFWNKTILKMMMHHIWNFEQLMLITMESCFQMSWGRRKTAWGQLCNSRSQQIFFQSPDTHFVQFTLQLDNTHNPEVQILSILQHFFRWNWRPLAAHARPALRPKAASLLVWTGGPQGPESGLHKAL